MFGDIIKKDDFKNEKHVPTIDSPEKVKKDEPFMVELEVGKEIAHPNTVEHHIEWMDLYVHYDGDPNTVHVGRYEFGPVVGEPKVKTKIKLPKSGTLLVMSHCNIHGLWEASKKIEVE